MFSFRRDKAIWAEAERTMTPMEASRILRNKESGYRSFSTGHFESTFQPRRFERVRLAESANLYSANLGARTLIVGMAGRHAHLFGPIWRVLQHLDDSKYDLLLVADDRRWHFSAGSAGFANSLPEMATRIRHIAESGAYENLITYGTSMGGFPALRLGGLLGAQRAVSIGGRYAWDIHRLQTEPGYQNGFDPLCSCFGARPKEGVAIYAEQVKEDAENVARLKAVYPDLHEIAVPGRKHDVPGGAMKRGNGDRFYEILFELNGHMSKDDLRAQC